MQNNVDKRNGVTKKGPQKRRKAMSNKLVLYFSVYGSAQKVANEIARQADADVLPIEPEVPYDSNRDHYDELARLAKREHDTDARPAIKNLEAIRAAVASHDVVFIGYPMWWYTFPMIVYTLFDEVDFGGKTIVPFNTHMGSRDGGTYQTVAELAPNATVLPGLPVEMGQAEKGASKAIAQWLAKIGQ